MFGVLKTYWWGEGKGILQLKNAVFKDCKKKIKNAISDIIPRGLRHYI